MVKERVLAVPDTSIFIAELPEATRNIIRKDLEEHAREHHYRLEWDRESKDYVAMSRRFCDMENIYTDTFLHFCETGEDIEPYEKSLKRTISIRLYQDEVEELCRKSGKVGLSIGELFENFVADLICGTHTNGSDERMYIEQWFDRCYFSIMPEETFLSYLLEMREIDSVLECWEILQELKNLEELVMIKRNWRYSRTPWKNIFRNIEPIQENRQKTNWKLLWKRCWNGIKKESIYWREMFQRNLWDGSRIGERKKTVISNAERIVLRNMYPPGCRVELEDMEADPYVKLSPGDLGTVQFVDDAGQIHVSWDCGHSLAMVFGVDHCRCIMREERLQEILQRVQAMPFESLEKMELYITEKLSEAFPKISFQEKEGQEVLADMGVAAFMKKDLGVAIQYETDSQQHIFIKKMEIQGQELERKNPFPVQKKR